MFPQCILLSPCPDRPYLFSRFRYSHELVPRINAKIPVIFMSKIQNPEFTKFASDLARAQDAVRSANEELIKLSQRFGRMMPKLQRLETPSILSWFNLYNKIKDGANKADDEIAPLLKSEQV